MRGVPLASQGCPLVIRAIAIYASGICVSKMSCSCVFMGMEPQAFGMGGVVDGYDR